MNLKHWTYLLIGLSILGYVGYWFSVKSCLNADSLTTDIIREKNENRVTRDTTVGKENKIHPSLKQQPYPSFDAYKVTYIDNKSKAKLDFYSNKEARNFRTILRKAYKADTSNFAGHYTFIYWGCGSPCQSSLLINRQTGKIYNAPGASRGYKYRADSKMLLVNPPDTSGLDNDCCKTLIYVFDEKTKIFTQMN